MDNQQLRTITGLSGVMIGVGTVAAVPLYFIYPGAPPAWNVLTRDLVALIVFVFWILFFAGFAQLIRQADAKFDWIASIVYGAGLLFAAVGLVATALEAGVVFGAPDGTLDPTIDGPLAHANILIHGSIKRILTVLLLVPAGYAVIHTRLFPVWVGRAAYAIALVNLAFVPSLYFGSDVTKFYSAIGWGNSALVASFIAYWIFTVGVFMLRRPGTKTIPTMQRA